MRGAFLINLSSIAWLKLSNQYGFRSGYNTTVCLVDLIDEVSKALDEETYAVSIFLDLRKAFDTVNYSILSSKLDLCGIRGNENQCLGLT